MPAPENKVKNTQDTRQPKSIALPRLDIIVVAIIIIMYVAKKGKLAKPTLGKEIAKSATPLTVTRIVGSLMSTFMSLIFGYYEVVQTHRYHYDRGKCQIFSAQRVFV